MRERPMTRDEARALFKESGLTYSVLTKENLQRLRELINSRMDASGCFKETYRCRQRAIIRNGYAEIKCRAYYFCNREAVSFNRDGFIGFAGWADDTNVQPIINGFADWVSELKRVEVSGE